MGEIKTMDFSTFLCVAAIAIFVIFGIYFLWDGIKSWKFVRAWKKTLKENSTDSKKIEKQRGEDHE